MSSAAGNASDTVPAFAMGSYFATAVCPTWLPTNHILFQLANIFLFLSYMAPAGLYGLLYLRMCLTLGSFFFALWGYVILCAFDTMVWNAFFTAINLVHVCVLMYVLRPVRLAPHMEVVYRELFQPLKVSRQQFQAAASCVKVLKDVEPHETYAVEHVTRADSLTLLLSGRFLVSHKGRPLQIVDRFEFLDSPEWFGVCGTGGDKFQGDHDGDGSLPRGRLEPRQAQAHHQRRHLPAGRVRQRGRQGRRAKAALRHRIHAEPTRTPRTLPRRPSFSYR
ncbi:hypothetical protein MRX96_011600 [Rhipicephalus microplus]